jgi:hypothetical protein
VKARRWGWDRWVVVAFLLVAWALRLHPILDSRFHPDEALYGYWGLLIANGRDLWLAGEAVYKPPLLPYLVAGTQALFGNSEFAVRLPGLAAGLLAVPLVAALARSLYRDRWTAAAAIGVALSPFAILFSATAFTDLPMVTLGLAACVAAVRHRPGWAGLLAGLAVAAKQTGLVWLPLVAVLQISSPKPHIPRAKSLLQVIGHWLLVVALVFTWDAIRVAQGARSFWRLGVAGYGGLRLIWPQELWTRLRGWIGLVHYVFVSPAVNGALLVGLPVLAWRAIKRRRYTREGLIDLLLVSFLVVYCLFHWLWAFQIWDRYLLPLMPLLAILLARVVTVLASYLQPKIGHWSPAAGHLLLVVLLALPAWNAAHNRYPVGGTHGAYDGIDEAAAFLRDRPDGTVLYQHWLGWEYSYYLFGGPIYLAYWPTPAWLAQDVQAFGAGDARYITIPPWESPVRVEQALNSVGYGLELVLTTTHRDGTPSFTVYHILPLSDR